MKSLSDITGIPIESTDFDLVYEEPTTTSFPWEKSLIVGFHDHTKESNHNQKPTVNQSKVIFANYHNVFNNLGGVGRVFSNMVKLIDDLTLVCYEPTLKKKQYIQGKAIMPVPINAKTAELFQKEFGKRYVWPLLHGIASDLSREAIDRDRKAVLHASKLFAEAMVAANTTNDSEAIYWINDYSLAYVPYYLKQIQPNARIGFSLRSCFGYKSHFPHFLHPDEHFWVRSLASANFVSFHRASDVLHFLFMAEKIAKHDHNLVVNWDNHSVHMGNHIMVPRAVPMGNDPKSRRQIAIDIRTKKAMKAFSEQLGYKKIITSISRFEIHKGIEESIDMIEMMLKINPALKETFIYVCVMPAVSNYTDLPLYHSLFKRIMKKIARINNTFGGDNWKPIVYINDRRLNDYEVTALHRLSTVWLVMSTADGFNHSSVEGATSKLPTDTPGVLVLSNVGSRDYLGSSVIRINPDNTLECAMRMIQALKLSDEVRREAQSSLIKAICHLSSDNWTASLITAIKDITKVPMWKPCA